MDNFNLFTHYFDPSPPNLTTIPDFPLTVLTNYSSDSTPWFGPAGLLGLGPSSTLLRRLYDNQLISSRSFGLYMGTAYQQSNGAINGSLTLGGYDSGRFDGEVHNFTISPANADAGNSPFVVTVSQMTLTTADGQTTDLVDQSFDAHLTTAQYQLNLPGDVTQHFQDVTSATPSNDELNVLRLPDNFDSSLTITLSTGLSLTYDAEWLRNVSNNSPISAVDTNSSPNSTSSVNLLGSAFLANVYLIANYDASPPTFHLANARPHGPYVMTQTLCPNTIPVPAQEFKISGFAASGIAGAIVGGVIGGIGLTFLVWWLARKYLQRRRWRKQAHAAMKGKGLEAGGKGSPSSTLVGEDDRGNSAEMATFAFDFNSGQHQAYQAYLHNQIQGSPEPKASAQSTVASVPEMRIQTQYARPLHNVDLTVSPITPATGVPLLFSQQTPGQSSLGMSHPDVSGISLPLGAPERTSSESARPRMPLNLQTQFPPPPKAGDKIPRKAIIGGPKKESMLKKVFPPPTGSTQGGK